MSTEEIRHRYGRVETRTISDWAPLNTDIFMCSMPPDESSLPQHPQHAHTIYPDTQEQRNTYESHVFT